MSQRWNDQLGVWENDKAVVVSSSTSSSSSPLPLYVFGYGSLCWRPGFDYVQSHKAQLTGYGRRFWQKSTDHRGTPEFPGLVCTLVPISQDHAVDGVVFQLAPEKLQEVVDLLDFRERGGYKRSCVQVRKIVDGGSAEPEVVEAIVYIADETNPHYTPNLTISQTADIIRKAAGPSGPNIDYVRNLHKYFVENGVVDRYMEDLMAAV
eukprot:PhF_6_TR24008/c0_g1_i1/m.33610